MWALEAEKHKLLDKTQAALKSPAVVRNDENIPNLAWIYNYAESKFKCLYWNFSIPIQPPRRELVWIICRDCVCEWVWFFFCPLSLSFLRCFIMKLLWSPKTTTNELFWEVFVHELTIKTPVQSLHAAHDQNIFKDALFNFSSSLTSFCLVLSSCRLLPSNSIFTGMCKLSVNVNGSVCYLC